MIITSASKYYFYFQFDNSEINTPDAEQFISRIKTEIPANKGRYWIRDKKVWAIHKDFFELFMENLYVYYKKLVFKQEELF